MPHSYYYTVLMKTAAIIAEYNPFHEGHKYHIEETKRQAGAEYCIILMSGNFVQRGAPAIFNKYERTLAALNGGADAVLELPALYATSSAEHFATAGVTILNALNIADFLSFGSECGDIRPLSVIAECIWKIEQNPNFSSYIHSELKKGNSYATSYIHALEHSNPESENGRSNLDFSVWNNPNNLLGIEYLKALYKTGSNMHPITVLREGQGYHDTALSKTQYASASAIRKQILEEKRDVSCLEENDFSEILRYHLLNTDSSALASYLDVSNELSAKINKLSPQYDSFENLCNLLKSKNLHRSRISRALLHILLQIYTPSYYDINYAERLYYAPFVRLLGYREGSRSLLSEIKRNSSIPLITKLADASNLLDDRAYSFLQNEIRISHIYETVFSNKTGAPFQNEWKRSPICVKS